MADITRLESTIMLTQGSCIFHHSCISVGTRKGYSVINCDPFGKIYSKSEFPSSSGYQPHAN